MLISVIIPTYQRPDLLSQCLECLCYDKQTLGHNFFEIIVSDDSRTEISKDLVEREFPRVRWIRGPRRGPASNRNNGAKEACGEWLAFLDDDCLPDSQWLASIHLQALSGMFDVIEGKTITPDKVDNPFRQGVENLSGDNFWSCNLAVRRDVFLSMGGFDEDFLEAAGEDMEFAFRIRKNKLRVIFLERAVVLHPVRVLSWRKLIWYTKTVRWMSLYYLKTGQTRLDEAGSAKVIFSVSADRFTGLLRRTWHLFKKFNASYWRTQIFWRIWEWITFPVVLPYVLFWEFRFREMMTRRAKDSDA
jgi:GT2 family glycosyltransferase